MRNDTVVPDTLTIILAFRVRSIFPLQCVSPLCLFTLVEPCILLLRPASALVLMMILVGLLTQTIVSVPIFLLCPLL
ncbi:hypothetical protein EDB19DRAFT_1656609, partial [Suillus lakei]